MKDYLLNPKVIHEILKEKKIISLFHANTVSTAITFIRNRTLLSRGFVEKHGLFQTAQTSDDKDKEFEVWDDVFMDGLDLHAKYSRHNIYGPILFVIPIKFLLSPSFPSLLITRNNPMYWTVEQEKKDQYYSEPNEFKLDYLGGKKIDARIMFTFRSPEQYIKLNKYCSNIIVDNPSSLVKLFGGNKGDIGEVTFQRIQTELQANGLGHIPLMVRHPNHRHYCNCRFTYPYLFKTNLAKYRELFKIA